MDGQSQTLSILKVWTIDVYVSGGAHGLSRKDTKWSGTIFNSVSEKDAEKLCEVTIQDHTHPRSPMKLDLFLQKSDSIRLRKFHDLADLDLLLPSFQYIAQFASLVPCEEKDKEAFTTMQKYLSSKGKVCVLLRLLVSILTVSVHLLHPLLRQRGPSRNGYRRIYVYHPHEQGGVYFTRRFRSHGEGKRSPRRTCPVGCVDKEISRRDSYTQSYRRGGNSIPRPT